MTTRLIEGDFPNYEQLIPSGYPNRLVVSRGTLEEAVAADADRRRGPRGHAGAARDDTADGLELSATAQERADAAEAIDAKFEGTDVTVAFNPQFLLDGLTVDRGRRSRCSRRWTRSSRRR